MPIMTSAPSVSETQTVPTKQRILYAAAELFRRRGYSGTGLKQISEESRAPFGSLYHHFPGGKEELGEDVIRQGAFPIIVFDALGISSHFAIRRGGAESASSRTAFNPLPIRTR